MFIVWPRNPLTVMAGCTINPSCIDEGFGPRNLLTGKPEEALVGFVVSPTFMLGIWHEGDWLKERFGSNQSMFGWYVEAPDLVGFCIC